MDPCPSDAGDPCSWLQTPTLSALADSSSSLGDLLSGAAILVPLALLVFLTLSAATLAAAEAALISLSRLWPEARAGKSELVRWMESPERTLETSHLGRAFAHIGLTLALWSLVVRLTAGLAPAIQAALTAALAVLVIFGLCESLPRAIGLRAPAATTRLIGKPANVLWTALVPFQRILRFAFGRPGAAEEPGVALVAECELELMMAIGGRESPLEEDEREMVEGVLELSRTTAEEIMVPRNELRTIGREDTRECVAEVFSEMNHSRLLVCGDSPDQVIGFMHRKEFLLYPERPWPDLIRKPLLVPPSLGLGELLERFRSQRIFLAVVADDYGGTMGIVTLKDVLEAIVGDIEDESSHGEITSANGGAPEEPIRMAEDGSWLVWGRVEIEDLNEHLPSPLDEERARTVSGFVINTLGHIPEEGELLESDGYRFLIHSMAGPRIQELEISSVTENGDGNTAAGESGISAGAGDSGPRESA